MARIFNIYFQYEKQVYNAVVSVRSTPFHTEYTLNNFDDALLILLPGNKILSRSPDHFIFQNTDSDNSPELMNAIIRSIAEHMTAKQKAD